MIVSASSVSYRIGETEILSNVDIDARPGEVTAVIGPNGAGKSSLLRLLSGLARANSGEISIDGRPIGSIPLGVLARRRGYMSPNPPDSIDFSVREVVAMGRHPWKSTRDDTDLAVDDSIDAMELRHLADRPHSTLSTGEARRTQLARLLAQGVPVLFADEPVSGLDIAFSELVLGRLRSIARAGNTVVTVLHDLNAAAQYSGHLVLVGEGHVIAAGSPEDVLNTDLLSEVYRHPVDVLAHPSRPGLLVLPGNPAGESEGDQGQ